MASDSSLINREVLLVEVSSKDEYLKIKDEIEDLSNNKIPEMIEKLCSNIFSEYDVVRLDNIEIDLGIISPSDLFEM